MGFLRDFLVGRYGRGGVAKSRNERRDVEVPLSSL
jgi:hypothetical protein